MSEKSGGGKFAFAPQKSVRDLVDKNPKVARYLLKQDEVSEEQLGDVWGYDVAKVKKGDKLLGVVKTTTEGMTTVSLKDAAGVVAPQDIKGLKGGVQYHSFRLGQLVQVDVLGGRTEDGLLKLGFQAPQQQDFEVEIVNFLKLDEVPTKVEVAPQEPTHQDWAHQDFIDQERELDLLAGQFYDAHRGAAWFDPISAHLKVGEVEKRAVHPFADLIRVYQLTLQTAASHVAGVTDVDDLTLDAEFLCNRGQPTEVTAASVRATLAGHLNQPASDLAGLVRALERVRVDGAEMLVRATTGRAPIDFL